MKIDAKLSDSLIYIHFIVYLGEFLFTFQIVSTEQKSVKSERSMQIVCIGEFTYLFLLCSYFVEITTFPTTNWYGTTVKLIATKTEEDGNDGLTLLVLKCGSTLVLKCRGHVLAPHWWWSAPNAFYEVNCHLSHPIYSILTACRHPCWP